MIVTCPNCQTRYNLPDDKVPPGGAMVKCSKCAHVFRAELPPATPEEEVENLFDEQSQAPDTGAGDDFDDAFDEVATGGEEEPPADDPVPEEEPADEPAPPANEPVDTPEDDMADPMDDLFGDNADEDMPDEDMPGMDDLFDDSDDAPTPDEGPKPSAPAEDTVAEDVESLFGDDEDDLFADDEPESEESDPGDLFDDDDDDADDLFADDDDEEGEEDEYEDDGVDTFLDEEPTRKKGGKSLGCLIIILVLAVAIGAAAYFKVWTLFGFDPATYFQNVPYIGKMFMEETAEEDAAPGESPADKVRKIELKNVKQYYVANEKTGNLFVVEGKAVNKFSKPKEQIKVEVVLYDGSGNVLVSQPMLCGNVLSQFQLQVQTQKEIEDGLSSEVGILSNNTFIRPGASTPFMAVFFNPPAGVKEFLVKVIDVGDPE